MMIILENNATIHGQMIYRNGDNGLPVWGCQVVEVQKTCDTTSQWKFQLNGGFTKKYALSFSIFVSEAEWASSPASIEAHVNVAVDSKVGRSGPSELMLASSVLISSVSICRTTYMMLILLAPNNNSNKVWGNLLHCC
ncbi:hypothetical protein KIL84_019867 [Mauremys mutica]|uniref:Uncharacterized protein n=1 Tax=Mauremys mutica TaxID=74926 RepID=A0A9D3XXD9_9SAUR|nr:hypothetical protein KIL84_019867 [Mauremys mutica]